MSEEKTRARAIEILENRKAHYYGLMPEWVWDMAIEALKQPKEITIDDVKEYCKPRCLTIISNELFYELTHPIVDRHISGKEAE